MKIFLYMSKINLNCRINLLRKHLRKNNPILGHIRPNYFRQNHQNHLLKKNIDRLTKKAAAPSNIAKTKTLVTAKGVFQNIVSSVEKIARMPPKNKVFVNNSLTSISKYIDALIPDYIRQVRRER